jgi:hypothetical protein
MPDLEWMNSLEGKTKDIILALYQTNLTDSEIASKNESTPGYVRKLRSRMRRHGFIFEKSSQVKPKSDQDGSAAAEIIKQTEKMLTDLLTREDFRKILADFKAGMALPDIAVKHGMPPNLLLVIWKGWMQIMGRNRLVKLCDLYGDNGVIQFHKIGEYLDLHNQSPKQLVDLLHSIGNLQQYHSELEIETSTLQEKQNIANDELDGVNRSKQEAQAQLDEILRQIEISQKELFTAQTSVKNLKDTEMGTRQSINELLSAGHDYVYDIGTEIANSVLVNDRPLREKAAGDLLDALAKPERAGIVLEAIAMGVKANLSLQDFVEKYEPLLPEYHKRIHGRITSKLWEEVARKSQLRPALLVNGESEIGITSDPEK